jgi:hypothetical protein
MNVKLVRLTPGQLELCQGYAEQACMGGHSQVRTVDRQDALYVDQLVGQIGMLAGHLYYIGDYHLYVQARETANAEPWKGDGGYDIPGVNVDFKSSLMRASANPADYRLLVRPAERHRWWVYVLVLLSDLGGNAILMGWATDEMLPAQVEQAGPFEGAHMLHADQLRPMQEHPPLWGDEVMWR